MALPLPDRSDGQVIDETWFDSIAAELTTLAARVLNLEASETIFRVSGAYYDHGAQIGVGYLLIEKDITIEDVQIMIEVPGSSGDVEIDLAYQRPPVGGPFGWTSIFSTLPSLPDTASEFEKSTNGVLAETQLLAGDILRLSITDVQEGNEGFQVIMSKKV